MATPKIVPRAAGEGSLGDAAYGWGAAFVTNTTTSSASQGGRLVLAANDGAVMANDHRLGVIEFQGAQDSSGTLRIGARIEAICRDAWDGSNHDADLVFYTTDGTTESAVLTLDSDKLASFASSLYIGGSTISTAGNIELATGGSGNITLDAAGTTTIESAGLIKLDGETGVEIENGVVDQVALLIDAANTTANIIDIDAQALTTGDAIFIDANSLTSGSAITIDADDALTASNTRSLVHIDYDKSGASANSTLSIIRGIDIDITDAATNQINANVTQVGVDVSLSHASNQGSLFQTGFLSTNTGSGDSMKSFSSTLNDSNVNAFDFYAKSSAIALAGTEDYFYIRTSLNGATTLGTVDYSHALANFEIAADGNITLDAVGNISLESGTTSGNHVTIDHRKFTKTSTTDGDAVGDIVYFGGTTSMTIGAIYHYKSDGTWELADADAAATSDGLLAVALGEESDVSGMLVRGTVTLDHDPGAVGDVLYLSTTAGDSSATAPSSSGDVVRIIGYCLDASNGQIWFNPDSTFVEIS